MAYTDAHGIGNFPVVFTFLIHLMMLPAFWC